MVVIVFAGVEIQLPICYIKQSVYRITPVYRLSVHVQNICGSISQPFLKSISGQGYVPHSNEVRLSKSYFLLKKLMKQSLTVKN